jgi:hypothetical protein
MADLSVLYFKGVTANYIMKASRSRGNPVTPAQDFAAVPNFNSTLYGAALDPALNAAVPTDFVIEDDPVDARFPKGDLGKLLVYDEGVPEVRFASQAEVDAYADQTATGDVSVFKKTVAVESVKRQIDGSMMRRLMSAHFKVILRLAEQINGIKDAIDTATDLPSVKSNVGALPILPDWDQADLATFFRNQISVDD